LKQCATRFFKEDIFVRIQDDISSNEYTHIVFRVDFNNFMAKSVEKRLMEGPKLPDVTSATFFKVFPFAILIDPHMRIYHVGQSIKSVFPADTSLVGRHVEDIFRLVRPDILLEWNRVCLFMKYEKRNF
jgi:hypothetical protein